MPVLRICEALLLSPFHVLMACILGSELNESFNTYWVIVKKDIYKLAQKSLDIRSNMLNTECHVNFMTACSAHHTSRNLLNKSFSPSHLTQCKSTTNNSFWWYNQMFFYILIIFWGYTCSHWPSDHCQPLSTRNMSEIVLLMVHNQSVFIVSWEMWTVYAQVWIDTVNLDSWNTECYNMLRGLWVLT